MESFLSPVASTYMLHRKVITITGNISYLCWSFGKQLASYLQVTGLRVVTHMGCALYLEELSFLN